MSTGVLEDVRQAQNLPTLPTVAIEVLELTRQDDVSVEAMAEVIGRDPALTAKVLKVVNSSLFGMPRQITSLEQAMKLLGLRSVRVLALSFSLASTIGGDDGEGFDFEDFWKRSLLAAVAGKLLGNANGARNGEEAFIAGLLSDIGRLALHRCARDQYDEALRLRQNEGLDLCEAERRTLGVSHAAAGAELLTMWGLPATLCDAVRMSHGEIDGDEGGELAALVRAGVVVSELFCDQPDARELESALASIGDDLRLERDVIESALAGLSDHVSDMASLMSIRLGETPDYAQIQAAATAQLAMLTVESEAQLQAASTAAESARREADQLREENRSILQQASTDSLTGLANRAAFDERLDEALRISRESGAGVGLILIDIDHFKSLNDTHGHLAGDAALRAVGETLRGATRRCGFAARYGGEEFAVLLDEHGARAIGDIAELIRQRISATAVAFGGTTLRITASAGAVVERPVRADSTASSLLETADRRLYRAKKSGRNRVVLQDEPAERRAGAA